MYLSTFLRPLTGLYTQIIESAFLKVTGHKNEYVANLVTEQFLLHSGTKKGNCPLPQFLSADILKNKATVFLHRTIQRGPEEMNHISGTKDNMSRILIETVVKKTLKDILEDPERSIRNLVDMALHFSEGRFQKRFFELAQTMLKNEHSPYYDLIQDTVFHVDAARILRFGMNLGYNSCTLGARIIREIENKDQYNIPWAISLDLYSDQFCKHQEIYQNLIFQGEELGVYTWMLFGDNQYQNILPLIQEHPDSAFILFCDPRNITPSFLDGAAELYNLMPAIRYSENASELCMLLREMGLLYSVYEIYNYDNMNEILSGNLFCSTEQLHPVFTGLLPDRFCSDGVKTQIHDYIIQARNNQIFQTIPWEMIRDVETVDGIISNDTCMVKFDWEGYLYPSHGRGTAGRLNLFQNSLSQILKCAFPKE